MKNRMSLSAAAGLLFLPMLAQAVEIAAGTAELITIRQCVSDPVTGLPCYFLNPSILESFGGSPGAASSTASGGVPGIGSASGSVALSGAAGAPTLKAQANAGAGWRTNTNSVALQRYTYTGSTATSRTFGGTLTYAQSGTGTYPNGVG